MTPTPPTRRQIDEMTAYQQRVTRCTCHACWPIHAADPPSVFMRLCPNCGNKRCPKASHHDHACTGSNDAGQPGSVYQRSALVFPSAGTCITPSQGAEDES